MASKLAILPENHPTVLRRLAREIRQRAANGVYATFFPQKYGQTGRRERIVGATFSKGTLSLCTMGDEWLPAYVNQIGTATIYLSSLDDGAGNIISVSRTACGQ